jgi:FkbM family methyltransferase
LAEHRILGSEYTDLVSCALENCRPGVYIDVGANIGGFSLRLAHELSKMSISANVHSYEPNPAVFDQLQRNFSLNKRLCQFSELMKKGVGENAGSLRLSVPKRNAGCGSLMRDYTSEPSDMYDVEVVTLDSVYGDESCDSVAFIKVDTEGFEESVFRGAEKVLTSQRPPIFAEMTDPAWAAGRFLSEIGYRPKYIFEMDIFWEYCEQ